jgi:hypothetical protein
VDTSELPIAADPVEPAPVASSTSTVSYGLLDEIGDAAHARRRTVGTIGATIAVTGAVLGAVALLPF